MCLIIASQTGASVSDDMLSRSFDDNPHGWGIVYFDGARPVVKKGMDKAGYIAASKEAFGRPYINHTRWATSGKNNTSNCHPFKVAKGLWMAHNGVFNIDQPVGERSDTWHYARFLSGFIKNMTPQQITEYVKTAAFVESVEKFCGNGNKVVFMTPNGEIVFANAKAGQWEGPIWYSNTFSHADNKVRRVRSSNKFIVNDDESDSAWSKFFNPSSYGNNNYGFNRLDLEDEWSNIDTLLGIATTYVEWFNEHRDSIEAIPTDCLSALQCELEEDEEAYLTTIDQLTDRYETVYGSLAMAQKQLNTQAAMLGETEVLSDILTELSIRIDKEARRKAANTLSQVEVSIIDEVAKHAPDKSKDSIRIALIDLEKESGLSRSDETNKEFYVSTLLGAHHWHLDVNKGKGSRDYTPYWQAVLQYYNSKKKAKFIEAIPTQLYQPVEALQLLFPDHSEECLVEEVRDAEEKLGMVKLIVDQDNVVATVTEKLRGNKLAHGLA